MIKSLLTILVLSVCCSDAVYQFCRGATTSAANGVCPYGSVVVYGNQCCATKDYYEVSSLACKGDVKPANYGGCLNGQSIVYEHCCCDNKDIYDTTTASCRAGGVLGVAVNGVCGTNYYVTKGNLCCRKEDIYFISPYFCLARKSATSQHSSPETKRNPSGQIPPKAGPTTRVEPFGQAPPIAGSADFLQAGLAASVAKTKKKAEILISNREKL